jgi:hypothetical protein
MILCGRGCETKVKFPTLQFISCFGAKYCAHLNARAILDMVRIFFLQTRGAAKRVPGQNKTKPDIDRTKEGYCIRQDSNLPKPNSDVIEIKPDSDNNLSRISRPILSGPVSERVKPCSPDDSCSPRTTKPALDKTNIKY